MRNARLYCFFLLCAGLLPVLSFAQDLTGIWRGYFITEMGDQYRLEFQVEQRPSKSVKGVSYSYLDTRFYGKATMTGIFALGNMSFSIQELRTVEVRNMGGGSTCLMNYKLTYIRSGKEEFLEGSYMGKTEDRNNPKNNGKWGDCGGGTVMLRRVVTSDFVVEPFLKGKLQPKPLPEITKTETPPPAALKKQTTPARTTTAKAGTKPPATTRVNEVPAPQKEVEREKQAPVVVDRGPEKPKMSIPVVTRERKNELAQTITVTSNEIMIRLYDNGEIDNDTISVYLNGQLVIANKKLSATPITYTIKMDEDSPEQTLVMVAENLGRIPPNTSLMIVQDGDKRYQVSITSTEQKNAMVRFRYQKP